MEGGRARANTVYWLLHRIHTPTLVGFASVSIVRSDNIVHTRSEWIMLYLP